MSDEEIGAQIRKAVRERRQVIEELAVVNYKLTSVGRHLVEIGKALQSGAPKTADDPLVWQLRDLSGDIAAVLSPDHLRQMIEKRQQLTKQAEELAGYLRDMGVSPA